MELREQERSRAKPFTPGIALLAPRTLAFLCHVANVESCASRTHQVNMGGSGSDSEQDAELFSRLRDGATIVTCAIASRHSVESRVQQRARVTDTGCHTGTLVRPV